jgi:hypothetical protein
MRNSRRILEACGFIILAVTVVSLVSGCDQWGADPTRPIRVTLTWEAPIDLDLIVDEQPAHRQGGSADRTTGGIEMFEVARGLGTYVVAVQNLSGRGSARPVITVEGAKEAGAIDSTGGREVIALEGEVFPNARRDCWVACEIDAERGTVRRIEAWE